jgi:hypothetical protein
MQFTRNCAPLEEKRRQRLKASMTSMVSTTSSGRKRTAPVHRRRSRADSRLVIQTLQVSPEAFFFSPERSASQKGFAIFK